MAGRGTLAGWGTQEIREGAIDVLRQRGWTPGRFEADGPVSVDWAIALATGEAREDFPDEGGPYLTTVNELEKLLGRGSLIEWEMREGRTEEQVVALLRSGEVGPGYPLPRRSADEERRTLEQFQGAIARMVEAQTQMHQRSGPIYELARERGRIVSEAYRAAGRPRDVTRVRMPDGWRYLHYLRRGARWQEQPATEAEWHAWRSWVRQRERLRRALGIAPRPAGLSGG